MALSGTDLGGKSRPQRVGRLRTPTLVIMFAR
jgi:hypothetical protein